MVWTVFSSFLLGQGRQINTLSINSTDPGPGFEDWLESVMYSRYTALYLLKVRKVILEKGGWLSSSRSSNADILGYTFGPIFNPKYWNSTWECDSTINQAIFLQNLQPYHLAKCCKIICFFENDLTRQGRLFTFALFILGERLPAREPQHCFQSLRGLFFSSCEKIYSAVVLYCIPISILTNTLPSFFHYPKSPFFAFCIYCTQRKEATQRGEREKGGVRKTRERERSAKRRRSQRRGGDCRDRMRRVAPSWNLTGLPPRVIKWYIIVLSCLDYWMGPWIEPLYEVTVYIACWKLIQIMTKRHKISTSNNKTTADRWTMTTKWEKTT